MKKYLSLAFAFMLVLGMSFPALMADAYFEEDSKKENIIKTELSDTSLSDEAISFLAENNISLDSKVTPNSEVMSEGNGNTEYTPSGIVRTFRFTSIVEKSCYYR